MGNLNANTTTNTDTNMMKSIATIAALAFVGSVDAKKRHFDDKSEAQLLCKAGFDDTLLIKSSLEIAKSESGSFEFVRFLLLNAEPNSVYEFNVLDEFEDRVLYNFGAYYTGYDGKIIQEGFVPEEAFAEIGISLFEGMQNTVLEARNVNGDEDDVISCSYVFPEF